MSLTAETATAVCDLLEAQMTSAEFDAAVRRNKLLHDCKTKGFKRLQTLGPHAGGVGIKPKQKTVRMDAFEFATMGAKLVNSGQSSIQAWADQAGRNPGDLRYYCNKFGIELVYKSPPNINRDKVYLKLRQAVNRDGRRLKDAARRAGVSPTFVRTLLKERGRFYNAKTVKIERIKK